MSTDYTTSINYKEHTDEITRMVGAKLGEVYGKILTAAKKGQCIQNTDDLARIVGVTDQTIYNRLQDYIKFTNQKGGAI